MPVRCTQQTVCISVSVARSSLCWAWEGKRGCDMLWHCLLAWWCRHCLGSTALSVCGVQLRVLRTILSTLPTTRSLRFVHPCRQRPLVTKRVYKRCRSVGSAGAVLLQGWNGALCDSKGQRGIDVRDVHQQQRRRAAKSPRAVELWVVARHFLRQHDARVAQLMTTNKQNRTNKTNKQTNKQTNNRTWRYLCESVRTCTGSPH